MKFKKLFAWFTRKNKKADKTAFEFPTDSQTLLCLEAARLSVDHIVNF